MAETGLRNRFPPGLDPQAEEFRPRNPNPIPVFSLPPPPPLLPHQVYFPYPPPPPPPPMNEVISVPYAPSPAAYVSAVTVHSPIPPPAAGPTRALLLRPVPCDVSEATIRREMEAFGQVRWVQMERCSCDGIVTVHFYDLRHAEKALAEMRELHMQHQARLRSSGPYRSSSVILGSEVWPHFVIPVHTAIPEGHNQGTIVIFNLDSAVTTSTVKQTFQAFGAVKELRETPSKKHQKFVEFFDVRHAARALNEMNGREFHGKQIVIEFSRPGGNSWKKLNSLTNANVAPHELYLPELPQTFSSGNSRFNAVSPRMFSPQSQFSGGPNSGFGNAHVESLMTELNLGGIDERESGGQSRRVLTKKQTGQGIVTSPRQQPQQPPPPPPPPRSSRGKRGKQPKKYDTRFLINENIMIESTSDSRTTLMIKNIPNKYSQKLLLSMLDNHCLHCNDLILRDGEDQPLSSYDFVYLPIDFNNKCNVGYGFVNMTSPEATWRFYKAFHHQNWEIFNSRKICEVTYARVQGLEALKEHFKNSKFPSEMDHYLPVVFTPPRDGKRLTDPTPIFGVQHKSGSSSSTCSAINHPITLLLPPSHQHNHDSMDESTDHCSSRNGGEVGLNDDQDDDDDEDDRDS